MGLFHLMKLEILSNYIGFSLGMTTFTIRIGLTLRGTAALIRVPDGRIAQSVEQWIENPRVGGSIPPPATINSNSKRLQNSPNSR